DGTTQGVQGRQTVRTDRPRPGVVAHPRVDALALAHHGDQLAGVQLHCQLARLNGYIVALGVGHSLLRLDLWLCGVSGPRSAAAAATAADVTTAAGAAARRGVGHVDGGNQDATIAGHGGSGVGGGAQRARAPGKGEVIVVEPPADGGVGQTGYDHGAWAVADLLVA